jgi:hypothetical protein
MTNKTFKRYALTSLFIIVSNISLAIASTSAQSFGSLRVVAINGEGDPLPDTIVEIFTINLDECIFSGRTNSNGAIQINGIPEGLYIVEMKATRLPVLWINPVRIKAQQENDLGYRTLGPEENLCLKPGVDCLIVPPTLVSTQWQQCLSGLKLLSGENDVSILLEYEELLRRATKRADPEWPKGVRPGEEISIEFAIGIDGRVHCINDTFGKADPVRQAVFKAAAKWRFQPILDKGIPIAARGVLVFTVPYSYPPK